MNTMQSVRPCSSDILSESVTLVKNMLRISISSICHIRELFQQDCFSKTRYGDAYIHQLKHSSDDTGKVTGNELSIKLCQWLEDGVFQAIDDGFLESLSFAIYVKDPITGKETIIENYTFKITQTKLPCGSNIISINEVPLISRDDMKNQAKQYIRQLTQFAATLDELPADRYVTMQLCYNEEAPHAYEPLHFRGSFNDKLAIKDDGTKIINMSIGEIKTNAARMQVEYNGIEDLSRFNIQQQLNNSMNEGDKEKVSFSSVKNLIIKNGRVTLNECSKVLSLSLDSVLAAMDHMMKDGLITNEAGYYCLNATPKRSQPTVLHINDYDVTPVQDSIEDFDDTQQTSKKRNFEDNNKNSKIGAKKNKIQPVGQLKLEKKEKNEKGKKKKNEKSERCSVTKEAIVLKRNRNDGVINCSQQSEI